jgi:8-oxo-dGTP pyrophosphatase MutT (NUDIX family)
MKGRAAHEAAGREAFEEAGLKGEVGHRPIGFYSYDKKLRSGNVVPCRVEVFPMQVREERRTWPEAAQRERAWFSPEEAAELVWEPELADLIRRFSAERRAG